MDIPLECFDTFIFDHIYAALLPAHPANNGLNDGLSNLSLADTSPWTYTPTSKFLSFQPRDAAYLSQWTRDNPYRQFISLFFITWFGGAAIYFIVSTLSYIFVFDKTTFKHPKFLKDQIKMEIKQACSSMPGMALLTAPCFWLELQGYSKLYDALEDGPGMWYDFLQFPLFILFTDCLVYFIHRGLHHPLVYKTLHKPHHKWIMPTPYASVAFHPVDGFLQSTPYHLFPFVFPLQKFAYLGLFVFVQIWTVFIHDGEYVSNSPVVNGAACHSLHHSRFDFNYGQYTTLWDRIGGTYLRPADEMFEKNYLQKKLI